MALGDDAIAGGMSVVNGATTPANTIDDELTRGRDYTAQGPARWKPGVVVPTSQGGTGSTTAAAARAALSTPQDATGSQLKFTSPGFDRIALEAPGVAYPHTIAYLTDIPGAPDLSSRVAKSGDTMSGDLYIPGASAATASYTIAYMNGDGRISKGASSERFKKYITALDPASLGDIWPTFHRFQMRSGDGVWRYGYIAERLAEHPDTEPFVIYERIAETDDDGNVTGSHLARDGNGNPVPESIDFIGLLLAQVAQLHQGLDLLAQRVNELEAGHAAG